MSQVFLEFMDLLKWLLQYKYSLTLALVIIWGSFLRLHDLGGQSLWIDEGFTIMQEKSISSHGYPLLQSNNIEYKDTLLPYLLAFLSIFSGEDIYSFRFVSASFGILSILAVYLLGKSYFGRNVGIFSAFLLSFSYWHIAWSRQIRSYSLFVFLFLLSFLFYYYYEKTGQKKWLYFLFGTLALSLLAKFSLGIILATAVIAQFLLKHKKIPYIAIGSLGILMVVTTLLSLEFLRKHLGWFQVNYVKYYVVDYFWNYFGLIFVLAIIGIYTALRTRYRTAETWPQLFLVLFCVALFFFSFFSLINQHRYLFFLTPLIFIYASYSVVDFVQPKKWLALVVFLGVIGIDLFTVTSLNFRPQQNYYLEKYTPQPNFTAAYRYIADTSREEKVISAYPFMDYIYLGRSDYALPISYTGLPDEPSLIFPTEYYTNAPRVFSPEAIHAVSDQTGAYVILDDMAVSRSDKNVIKNIQDIGQIVFEDTNEIGQRIWVYKLSSVAP